MNSPIAAPKRPENLPKSIILGTGAYAPLKILTNADLEKIVATNGPWIVSRTGIRERHIAARRRGDLRHGRGRRAARARIRRASTPSEIDLIIVGTVTGDMPMPSCAAFVQAKLGALNAFAFDVSAACAGSLYGLVIADQFIRNGMARRALVIGAETLSRVVDWTNRETCVLFGDAAGAMLLCASEAPDTRPARGETANRRLDDRNSGDFRRRQPSPVFARDADGQRPQDQNARTRGL